MQAIGIAGDLALGEMMMMMMMNYENAVAVAKIMNAENAAEEDHES